MISVIYLVQHVYFWHQEKLFLLDQVQLLILAAYNSYMYQFFSLHRRKIVLLYLLHCQDHILAYYFLQSLYLMMMMMDWMLILARNHSKNSTNSSIKRAMKKYSKDSIHFYIQVCIANFGSILCIFNFKVSLEGFYCDGSKHIAISLWLYPLSQSSCTLCLHHCTCCCLCS